MVQKVPKWFPKWLSFREARDIKQKHRQVGTLCGVERCQLDTCNTKKKRQSRVGIKFRRNRRRIGRHDMPHNERYRKPDSIGDKRRKKNPACSVAEQAGVMRDRVIGLSIDRKGCYFFTPSNESTIFILISSKESTILTFTSSKESTILTLPQESSKASTILMSASSKASTILTLMSSNESTIFTLPYRLYVFPSLVIVQFSLSIVTSEANINRHVTLNSSNIQNRFIIEKQSFVSILETTLHL